MNLSYPLTLHDGTTITTVADAVALMERLPEARQIKPVWQKTMQMLMDAKQSGKVNDMRHATAQLARALQVEGWRA